MNYRLGLKIETTSIGWCTIGINEKYVPIELLNWGVRCFPDGREVNKHNPNIPGRPLAAKRTEIRGMRRGYDRTVKRKRKVLKCLGDFGLFDKEKGLQKRRGESCPLKLRSDAIYGKLEPFEIGRALFHLQKRRGYKSNNREASCDDVKKIKLGINNLRNTLGTSLTLGQFLHKRNLDKQISTRFVHSGDKKRPFEFFPSREMVEREFNAIWEKQREYHPSLLTEEARIAIHKAIFFQRPLKPQPKGKCTIIPSDTRMYWGMPSAQRFRIIKEVNNIRFTAPHDMATQGLDNSQRKKLYNELCLNKSLTFKQIKKVLGLSSAYEFNLDTNKREGLKGDTTASIMRDEKRFGSKWDKLSLDKQDQVISKVLNDDSKSPNYMDDETLLHWLHENHGLEEKQCYSVLEAPLPVGTCSYGATVINGILPKILEEGMFEGNAIIECGWRYIPEDTGEIYDELPYYGEVLGKHVVIDKNATDSLVKQFGRIHNPTLHIALNQTRRLLNRLKRNYGNWPQQIVIQVGRNLKKGIKEITEIEKQLSEGKKKREKWRMEIERYTGKEATRTDYLKMKLWEELAKDPMHRKCVYTGKTINISMLFSDSVQVGYILPYSKTLDNSNANLILMTTEGAYIKGNQTPYEAFSDQREEYGYERILERSLSLPKSKQWRFRANAMDIFVNKARTIEAKSSIDGAGEIIETGLDPFTIKPLCDTDYVAKLIKKYLGYACLQRESGVTATPGNLTGFLRNAWGLNDLLDNQKNDRRNNSVDSLVLTLTTPFTIKKVAEAALLEEQKGIKITKMLDKPSMLSNWEVLQERAQKIVVSYKPDHGSGGQLCDETYYQSFHQKKDSYLITANTPIDFLDRKDSKNQRIKFDKLLRDIAAIHNSRVRDEVIKALDSCIDISMRGQITHLIKNYNLKIFEESQNETKSSKDARKTDIDTIVKIEKSCDRDQFAEMLNSLKIKFGKRTNPIKKITMLDEKTSLINLSRKRSVVGNSNHHAEVYSDGEGKWHLEIVSTFDANKKIFIPNWQQASTDSKLVMKLHINDMVAYENEGKTEIRKVKKISSAGQVFLVPHNTGKAKEEDFMWGASARQLQLKNARQLCVEIDGAVYDPKNPKI